MLHQLWSWRLKPPLQVHSTGFKASCKTLFIMDLLKELVAGGHRTLIFSQASSCSYDCNKVSSKMGRFIGIHGTASSITGSGCSISARMLSWFSP